MYKQLTQVLGQREGWRVRVPAQTLLECCKERIAHHAAKVEYWKKEHAKAEENLRANGVKLVNVPDSMSNSLKTTTFAVHASLDQEMANRLSQCENRVKANTLAMERFTSFKAMMSYGKGDDAFDLTVDDVLYFNLQSADAGLDEE